jgi:murein DD-endopeptidase MepM/ murein hydrolase activator NlpD
MNHLALNRADRRSSAGFSMRIPRGASFRASLLIFIAAAVAFPCAMTGCAPAPKYRSRPWQPEAGLRETSSRGTGIPDLGIRLHPPVKGFSPQRITSPFGIRSSTGRRHDGVDIRAGAGEEIFAAARGIVAFSGRKRGYGNVVILDHGDGISTLYAHLSYASVSAGDAIGQGEIVGRAGKGGRATGTHLHFEVRRGGAPVDPIPYLWLDSGGG